MGVRKDVTSHYNPLEGTTSSALTPCQVLA